jgi:hypothetical protein
MYSPGDTKSIWTVSQGEGGEANTAASDADEATGVAQGDAAAARLPGNPTKMMWSSQAELRIHRILPGGDICSRLRLREGESFG